MEKAVKRYTGTLADFAMDIILARTRFQMRYARKRERKESFEFSTSGRKNLKKLFILAMGLAQSAPGESGLLRNV